MYYLTVSFAVRIPSFVKNRLFRTRCRIQLNYVVLCYFAICHKGFSFVKKKQWIFCEV
jgi:hypothetical protein